MAAGAVNLYTTGLLNITQGKMNLATDTFVCLLATTAYAPNANTDSLYSQVSSSEVANGNGYTTGGVVLSSVADTAASGVITFTAAAAQWTAATIAARYAIICRRAGVSINASDMLLAFCDLTGGAGGSVSSTNGTFQVNWNASGIFTIAHSP